MPFDVLVAFAHLLCFVYWVGADLAVFYGAGIAADPALSGESRDAIGRLTRFVDQFPRSSVPLIGALGATLAAMRGYADIGSLGLAVIWLIALVWVAMNIFLFANHGAPEKTSGVMSFDLWFRIAILLVVGGLGLASLAGHGITDQPWLALKMVLFAATIVFALGVRMLFKPFRPALARIVAGNPQPDDETIMRNALARTRLAVLGIWGCAAGAALVALWKPF
jgi:uncharacterized membrane protein SirB2